MAEAWDYKYYLDIILMNFTNFIFIERHNSVLIRELKLIDS